MQKVAIVVDDADNRDFLYYLLRDEYVVFTYGSILPTSWISECAASTALLF
jgi:hypothetical protein